MRAVRSLLQQGSLSPGERRFPFAQPFGVLPPPPHISPPSEATEGRVGEGEKGRREGDLHNISSHMHQHTS